MVTVFDIHSEAYKAAHGRRLKITEQTLLALLVRDYLGRTPAPRRLKQTRKQREIAALERMLRLEDPRSQSPEFGS
jgi:hypothetical protein